jgi:hypothetical protein
MATTTKAGAHAPATLHLEICLEGKYVKSSQGEGHIQEAVRRHNIKDLPSGLLAYSVRVRPYSNDYVQSYPYKPDFWTTIYVSIEE